MKDSWFDRALATLAPQTALRRMRARVLLDAARGYDAASRDKRSTGWTAMGGGSAASEIANAGSVVRSRARDLVRNNPFAARIHATLLNNLVGEGILSSPIGAARWRILFDDWQDACDIEGLSNLAKIQELAIGAMCESGDALVRRVMVANSPAGIAPLRLQVLEWDFVDETKNGVTAGGEIDRGIEYDALGRRTAYWLYPHHPGDVAAYRRRSLQSVRVPADEVLHLFDRRRPGQDRGISDFAPVALSLADLKDHFASRLQRRKIENALAAFVHTDDPEAELGAVAKSALNGKDKDGNVLRSIPPGSITYLPPGTNVSFSDPSATAGFAEEAMVFLRSAAAGAQVMFEHMTGDYSQVNYTSYRAGHFEFRRFISRRTWLTTVPMLVSPVTRWFTDAAIAGGLAGTRRPRWEHQPPAFISVDPKKDAEAAQLRMRSGTGRLRHEVEAAGWNFEDFIEGYAEDFKAIAAKLGGRTDSDPRKPLKGGHDGRDQPDER